MHSHSSAHYPNPNKPFPSLHGPPNGSLIQAQTCSFQDSSSTFNSGFDPARYSPITTFSQDANSFMRRAQHISEWLWRNTAAFWCWERENSWLAGSLISFLINVYFLIGSERFGPVVSSFSSFLVQQMSSMKLRMPRSQESVRCSSLYMLWLIKALTFNIIKTKGTTFPRFSLSWM